MTQELIEQERSAFEVWYVTDMASVGFKDIRPAEIKAMREGEGYGEDRCALNSKWEGWQARAALLRPSAAEGAGE